MKLIDGKSIDLGLNEGGVIFNFHNINPFFLKNFYIIKYSIFFVKFNRFLQKNEKS
jgi:hypothetical protein